MKANVSLWVVAILMASAASGLGQAVTWSGGGDGASWTDPLNWSGGVVPGPTNDVVISSGAGTNVVSSSGSIKVMSIQCTKDFTISVGSLAVTGGASQLQGTFTMGSGTTLSASGSNTTFLAAGLVQLDGASLNVSGGAVLSLPGVQSYQDTNVCCGASWQASGAGSVLSLPGLATLMGASVYPVSIQALAGGQVQLGALVEVKGGRTSVLADGTNSVVDSSALISNLGRVTVESRNGGTVDLSLLADGQSVSLTLGANGHLLAGVLTNIDGASLAVSGGAVLSLPGVQSYQDTNVCCGASWQASGAGSVLSLPGLATLMGASVYPVSIQALAGGQVQLGALVEVKGGRTSVLADGTNSVVDLSALISNLGRVTVESRNGGTVDLSLLADGQSVSLTLEANGHLLAGVLTNIDGASLAVSGGAVLSLPGVQSYQDTNVCCGASWQASGAGSVLSLPGLATVMGASAYPVSIQALAGGQVQLGALVEVKGGRTSVLADGTNSVVDLEGFARLVVPVGAQFSATAQNGGYVDLSRVESISGGNAVFLADGTGCVIDLHNLSSFLSTGNQSSLTARNGGVVLLREDAFFLSNVAITIPPGNLILPPTIIPSSTLTLYGKAWHSYWVEQRDTSRIDNPWIFLARVPLTNDFQAFAPAAPANRAFRVWEFVADPSIVDIRKLAGPQIQLVLYGTTNGVYDVQRTNSLANTAGDWPVLATANMTNSFRIFPPVSAADPQQFYRAVFRVPSQ